MNKTLRLLDDAENTLNGALTRETSAGAMLSLDDAVHVAQAKAQIALAITLLEVVERLDALIAAG